MSHFGFSCLIYTDMTVDTMTDKNFGLSEEDFTKLVSEMKNGNESLFETIFLSQFETSIRYVMSKYRTSREDSYDVCMDSLIYFRKLLISGKIQYGNLKLLFNKISAQNYLKYKKKNSKYSFSGTVPEREVETAPLDEADIRLLNKAWNSLGDECKYILKNFYYNDLKLYEIAETLSKTPSAIRKKKERCINTLRLNFRHLV